MAYNTVNVGTAATLVVGANPQRQSLIIVNSGPSTCYLGNNNSISVLNTIFLEAEDTFTEDSGGDKVYQGDVYALTATGNTTVLKYWERTK